METTLNRHKKALIDIARNRFEGYQILPCGCNQSLDDCFTLSGTTLMFWFNTNMDKSTRMIKSDIII